MKKRTKIAAALLVVVPVMTALFLLTAKVVAQQVKRLQVHADEAVFGRSLSIVAVCDTGNGTMLYVTYWDDALGNARQVAMTSVPNGCTKTPAERSR